MLRKNKKQKTVELPPLCQFVAHDANCQICTFTLRRSPRKRQMHDQDLGKNGPSKQVFLGGARTSLLDHFNKLGTNSQAEEASTSETRPIQPVVAESVPVDRCEQKDLAANLHCNICLGVP